MNEMLQKRGEGGRKIQCKSAKMCKKFKSCKESNEKFRRTKYHTLKEILKIERQIKFMDELSQFVKNLRSWMKYHRKDWLNLQRDHQKY